MALSKKDEHTGGEDAVGAVWVSWMKGIACMGRKARESAEGRLDGVAEGDDDVCGGVAVE